MYLLVAITCLLANIASGDLVQPTLLNPAGTNAPLAEEVPTPQQRSAELSLATAESLALGQHPQLAAAQAAVRAARGRWVQAGLKPNPTIGYVADEIGNEDSAGLQGGFISQRFVTAGKLHRQRAVVAQEVAQAEQRARQVQLRVLTNVRTRFYQALVAQKSLALADQVLDLANQGLNTATALVKAEEGTRIGVLQANIQLRSAETLKQQAHNERDAAWRALAAAIGSPEMPRETLHGNIEAQLPEIVWDEALARLLAESPELAELQLGTLRADRAVDSAIAQRVPDVTVQTAVQVDTATEDTVTSVQVSVPWPLFNCNQGNIAAAQAEASAARSAVLTRQLELQRRLASTFANLASARQRVVQFQETILPAAAESRELVQQAYAAGELGYLEFLNAQRVYLDTNREYLSALAAFWQNWAAIEGLVVTVQ